MRAAVELLKETELVGQCEPSVDTEIMVSASYEWRYRDWQRPVQAGNSATMTPDSLPISSIGA